MSDRPVPPRVPSHIPPHEPPHLPPHAKSHLPAHAPPHASAHLARQEQLEPGLQHLLNPISRRSMLSRSLLAGAVMLGGLETGCSSPPPLTLPLEIRHLTVGQYTLFEKLVEVFLPLEGTGFTPVSQVPVMKNIDEIFGALSAKVRDDLGKGLKLFEYGSIVLGLHLKSFTHLDTPAATAYCERWMHGNQIQRAIFSALKQFVYVSYWREQATWGPVDYDGPLTKRYGIPRLGHAPLPDA